MSGHFDLGGVTPARYFFSIAIVLGLLFAMISTDEDANWVLLTLQWQLQTLVPMGLLIGAHMALLGSSRFTALNAWFALLVSGLVGATLFAPLALAIELWLEPANLRETMTERLIDEWFSVTPPVMCTWLALNAPWLLGFRLQKNVETERPDSTAPVDPASLEFVALLPAELQGRPLLLKSELHYLMVVTEQGRGLVLFNLGDAVASIPPGCGILVHRSYWVAFEAIEELIRRGRQGELRLAGGEVVPVSRNRLAEVDRALKDYRAGRPEE